MSYDLGIFKLREGVRVEDINAFLDSEEYDAFLEEVDKLEEANPEAELPMLPEKYVDTSMDCETFHRYIGKEMLRYFSDFSALSGESQAALATKDNVYTDELLQQLDMLFEFQYECGVQMFSASYSGDMDWFSEAVAGALEELHEKRIAVYDPQEDAVYDGTSARLDLESSTAGAAAVFNQLMGQLQDGEFEYDVDEEDDEE